MKYIKIRKVFDIKMQFKNNIHKLVVLAQNLFVSRFFLYFRYPFKSILVLQVDSLPNCLS